MASYTQYQAFRYRHHINLADYLGSYYGLKFIQQQDTLVCESDQDLQIIPDGVDENLWIRSDVATGERTGHNVARQKGDVVAWEALQHDCSMREAVHIVKQKQQLLSSYSTNWYRKYETVFRRLVLLLNGYASQDREIQEYLTQRTVEWESVKGVFQIGTPIHYQQIVQGLQHTKLSTQELDAVLESLFIARNDRLSDQLPLDASVIVPVLTSDGDFLGFHGRRAHPISPNGRYFHTGHLTHRKDRILYGEHIDQIQTAMTRTKQAIIVKGMFESFTTFQTGHEQVLAVLNARMSGHQFDRVHKLPVKEVVLGLPDPKERDMVLAMRHQKLQHIDMSVLEKNTDIDEFEKADQIALMDLVEQAKSNQQIAEQTKRTAAIRQRNARLETLTEEGRTFLIPHKEIKRIVTQTKWTAAPVKKLLRNYEDESLQSVEDNTPFLRIPQPFMQNVLHKFGPELRTLLFLMMKSGRAGMVRFKNDTLQTALNLSENQLRKHLQTLEGHKYLFRVKQVSGKGRSRTVHFEYYPTLIRYV